MARGAGAALGALGMVQDFRRQSREDRDRAQVRTGVRRLSEVFRGQTNQAPMNMDPEVLAAADRSGFAPGPKASDEEIELINLRSGADPYGAAEQLQQIAGRRPVRLQQRPRTLEELRTMGSGLQQGEQLSAENVGGMSGVDYRVEPPKPDKPKAADLTPTVHDYGHGKKLLIYPDGRQEVRSVPVAPRQDPQGRAPNIRSGIGPNGNVWEFIVDDRNQKVPGTERDTGKKPSQDLLSMLLSGADPAAAGGAPPTPVPTQPPAPARTQLRPGAANYLSRR